MVIDAIETHRRPFLGIVGDADGFDFYAWEILASFELPRMQFDAKWKELGRSAGHQRNDVMLAWLVYLRLRGWHTSVIAGWDGSSPGTKSMIEKSERKGFHVWRLAYYAGNH